MTRSEAITRLKEEGLTLVLYNGQDCFCSRERGVAPLLSLLDARRDVSSLCAVDKVVGRAAAFLYIALGIRTLHAVTVSEAAKCLLSEHSVALSYEVLVPRILNRAGNGYCPMESAVLSEEDVGRAVLCIRETLAALRK